MPASLRLPTLLLGVVLALAHAAPRAPAHGGVYRGPGATVPPGAVPTGPTTPATGAATVPGGPTGDLSSWTVWWSYRRDPLIDLRAAVHAGGAATAGGGFPLGRGERLAAGSALVPSARDLRERVVPALLAALEGERNRDLRGACMIALARIGAEGAARELRAPLAARLDDPDQEVAETAALALGILGDDSAVPTLAHLLADDEAGRRLVGERAVPERTRAFAAYGLGLAAQASEREEVRRFAVGRLAAVLERERFAARDVPVACVLSIGLAPLAWEGGAPGSARSQVASASRGAQVRFLLGLFTDGSRDGMLRAQVPGALAQLLQGIEALEDGAILKHEVAGALVTAIAAHSGERVEVRQGCVIALGLIGDGDGDGTDVAIRAALARRAADGEVLERRLALVALAEAATRAGRGPRQLAALDEVRGQLLGRLGRGTSLSRPWTAFALALAERAAAGHGMGPAPDSLRALREALVQAASSEEAAGHCLALGLLRDPQAVEPILARFDASSADDVQGYAAVALGLLGSPRAAARLRAVLKTSRYRPALLRDCAIALALLGDKGAVPLLVSALREAHSLSAQAAIATALGTIGDARAMDVLLQLLSDGSATDRARAFAAAALGRVADRRPLPWNEGIARTACWVGAPETLSDPATGTGVLDLF